MIPKTKSSEQITEWVDEYGPSLFRQAYLGVGNRQLAEDLVQDTFITAVEKSDSFRGDSSPGTWLSAILRNKIIDRVRKPNREQPLSQSFESDSELDAYFNSCGAWRGWFFKHWTDNPHEVLENKGFANTLISCLTKLPLHQRQVFMTRVMDHVSTEDVCREFELSEGNIAIILFRARMRLRGCLEQNWFKLQRVGGVE
jgi:RNA polymerase sigma-70 factor (ECF subfamily)